MPFPPITDQLIRNRFDVLLSEAQRIERINTQGWALNAPDAVSFHALKTSCLSLLNLLSTQQNSLKTTIVKLEKMAQGGVPRHDTAELLGIIQGLKSDYETGMLDSLANIIEANVAGDYLGQAERLLNDGQRGKYDHVPAAVLTGAILEDALRRLCQRQNPPISVGNAKGEPKTLNPLINDLKAANLFAEPKAAQLRGWAAIRNAAAHGEFEKFDRNDVEQMLAGVQNFLADYL